MDEAAKDTAVMGKVGAVDTATIIAMVNSHTNGTAHTDTALLRNTQHHSKVTVTNQHTQIQSHTTQTGTTAGAADTMWQMTTLVGGVDVSAVLNNNTNTLNTPSSLPTPTQINTHTTPCFNSTSNNYYALLSETQDKNNYAILNSDASDNYLTPMANVKTKTTQHRPIQVTLPDTTTLQS
eukprot:CCRYP_011332-RA/>CCRYP_011332-RA protein AED:0.70 eAED:0.43 QI:0/0/0/0.5/0/0/2/0/179